MNDKEFDVDCLNKAYESAVNAAIFLKKGDERFKGVNPMIPIHVGLLENGRPYINITCADSKGLEPQTVVLTEQMAQDIVREVGACLSVLRAEQAKEK